ncbi:peptidylprolyl isomerase [Kaistella jeonii]|uniref:Periplasmic chaperone PpiD n=1 Tax=Kaistella jeonii TaxID=266749 RepID=A0A0C1FBS7_9FLAO|nr:peptidylprolyl isomerase [Kaistella jeonii]KIA89338.1 peptidylprolyl isomerase [Kaistella jeonii]SFC03145.1 peptidyl-prolyl cis-trans isomerase D [Kaistella jeonii]VEI96657.1 Peptidyl-prolyl cis-trans isomerase surA [Kaistella jeonii]
MAVLGEIRNRPWLLMGIIAIAMLAFVVNPDSLEKLFGAKAGVYGKVNGDEITKEDYDDQLFMLQQQAQQKGQPSKGLEEQAWQLVVQSKLIKQQFEKMGLTLTNDMFWNQLQFDPMFAQNKENFDAKGNFKVQEIKKQIEELQKGGNAEMYNNWLKTKKSIEYRMMARQLFANVSTGITVGKKEAEEMMKQRDQVADIDFVKVDYNTYAQKNPVKVTTQDLADYIKKHPVMYKRDASRNIGLVYFPAAPSTEDDKSTETEINKLFSQGSDVSGGKENFQNTTNDSMFVALNSDMPFNPQYFSQAQLPVAIKDKVAASSVGTTFGPYKEQNFYVVTKLLDKKPSDSTLSRHILVSYKGNQAGANETRSKEQAKKLADSIEVILKADPAKFTEFLKYSSDPGSAAQGGSVGWTTPATPFVPEYLNFLAKNGKGATAVVETQFGYHIINIEDKKSGAMTYKVANLVKAVKPSDKTENEIYTKATKFIQQVQGKTFNDFSNVAKKNSYIFSNPKEVGRFQGQLPGLGTDKDEEIIAWAFNKKRNKGDTDIFTVDGTGDRIVAFLNGVQDAGTADPEAVREQLEPLVKNKILAKQISDKITAAKATSLDQIAKLFGSTKQSAQANMLSPQIAGAMEPRVAGAAFGVAKGKLSNPVEGMTGVYVLVKKSETINKQPGDIKQITQAIAGQNSQQFGQSLLKSLQDNANIKDYRIEVYNRAAQQQ